MQEENQIQTRSIQSDVFREILRNAYEMQDLLLIYRNHDDVQKFLAGRISELFENELIIAHYLPNGQYDGYIVIEYESIYRLEAESKYVKKIGTLNKTKEITHSVISGTKKNGYLKMIEHAYNSKKIISIELNNSGESDVVGFIETFDDNYCSVKSINDYGEDDGNTVFRTESITTLSYDGDDEITLYKLYSGRKP